MTTHSQDHRSLPSITCWFCSRRLTVSEIERDGIIRSRRQNLGGPYRLLFCAQCGRENICERSGRGRWFASPNLRVSLFEYFFSQLLDTRPEDFLAAASWFKENEARRRYFFEREGDMRYSGSWLNRFWPQPAESSGHAGSAESSRASAGAGHRRASDEAASREEQEEKTKEERTNERTRGRAREIPRRPGHLLSPYEILGLPAMASTAEIRAAFRRLAKQWHPDKVYHLGEEAQRLAHDKFTRLKAAYDALLARRDDEE